MSLKQYNVTPSVAATDTDLVATVAEGYVLIILSLQIVAPTLATVKLKIYNASGTLAQTVPLDVEAGDTVVLDHKIVIPAGGKLAVNSTATNTSFSVHGNLGAA